LFVDDLFNSLSQRSENTGDPFLNQTKRTYVKPINPLNGCNPCYQM